MFALLIIQAFQISQLYDRKSSQFKRKLNTSIERIALQHEKAEDIKRYLQIVNKDFSGQYKDILKEEFQNLLSLQESISIKDTSIMETDGMHKYLVIKGKSFDSLSGISAEHRVMARDVRQLRELFDKQNTKIPQSDSVAVAIQLDHKVIQQIFKKAKFVNEMLVETFRNNVYLYPSERIDVEFLDSVIRNEIDFDELPVDFKFMVEDENLMPVKFKLAPSNYSSELDTTLTVYSKTSLFPSNILEDRLTLHLYFPSKNLFLFKEMMASLGANLILVLIIVVTLLFMFRTITTQQRFSILKSDFISNMTHEFKTPISTISLACEAMSDADIMGDDNQMSAPYVRMIDEENKRLSLLVESILQSAAMDRGKMSMNRELIVLNEVVFDVAAHLQLRIDSLGGKMTTDITKSLVEVTADKMHLSNCVNNLIDNAIKYSVGQPQINVKLYLDGQIPVFEVTDQGMGIKKEHVDKIFDKLYRVP
ncbi:MAG: two-component system phosphate regulon sensor histidine kinase PhoR, partial [Psychromonas sp.]